MQRRAVAVVAVWLLVGGVGSCATPSTTDQEETEKGAVGAPAGDEQGERPVWAEGPVDDTTADDEPDAEVPADEETDEPRRSPSPQSRPPTARADGLEGVFPDETVNLDFRKAAIRRVFRIFKVKARVELVLDSGVDGRITVRTEEIPLREAFRAVLAAADLTFERRRGVLVVKPE